MKKISTILFFIISITKASYCQTDTSIVALSSIDSTIIQDVRYATQNNFTGKILYPTDKVYIRKAAGKKLSGANQYLIENYNLRIKIFDGYRPLSIQRKLWEIVPDEKFVANPAKGSRHNRGAAVDITLVDHNGNELEMGTGYDDFTENANPGCENISEQSKRNRKLLNEVMTKFGFDRFETEWWHFDFRGWEKFSILIRL